MEGRDHEPEEDRAAWEAKPADAAGPAKITAAKLTTEEADIPMSVVRGGSKKKIVLVALASVALLGAAAGGFGYYQNRRARSQTEAAFGELSQCLLGEQTSSAEVALRFRRHQVALMGKTTEERSDGNEAWPERCAKAANQLVDAADAAGLESNDGNSLKGAAEQLSKALAEKRGLDNDISALLKAAWEQAEKAKIKAPRSSVAGPPEHARPATIDDIAESSYVTHDYLSMSALHLPPNPSGERFFFFDNKGGGGPFYCRIRDEGLGCKKLPGELAKVTLALSVIGSQDPGVAPLFFAGSRGEAGVYRGDTGAKVDKLQSVGGYARKDGAVVLLGIEEGKMVLSFQKAPGEAAHHVPLDDELKTAFEDVLRAGPAEERRDKRDSKLDYENGYFNTQLVHGSVFVRLWDAKLGWRVYAIAVGPDGHLQKAMKIGSLDGLVSYSGVEPGMTACRAGDHLVLRARQSAGERLAFFADGNWTAPIESKATSSALLDCADAQATLSESLGVSTCTSASCSTLWSTTKGLGDLAPRTGLQDVAATSEGSVAIWGAGQRGGIRARPVGGDSKTPTISVFFDDLVSGGKVLDVPTVTAARLIPAGKNAVLLMQTSNGLSAWRVSAKGEVSPDRVVWE